jgi:putative transposase
LRYLEQEPVRTGMVAHAGDWPWSSASHHLGRKVDAHITGLPEYWALGNTPFERELAWQRLLDDPLPAAQVAALAGAASAGWAHGSPAFVAQLQLLTGRPLQARPRGRPRSTTPARGGGVAAPQAGTTRQK